MHFYFYFFFCNVVWGFDKKKKKKNYSLGLKKLIESVNLSHQHYQKEWRNPL
jgi:hypothetical protein